MTPLLLDNLLTYLVDGGIVRRMSAPPSALSPMIIDPKEGVPAPATSNTGAVVGAYLTGGIRAAPREAELRRQIVDFWFRTKTSPQAMVLDELIRGAVIDRVDWQMGGMWISECLQWRELQRFSSDQDGYTFISAYIFERRAT